MALLFNLMEKGHLNWTIGLPLAACDRESGADLQFEPLKTESNHATRAYIHHRSWLGYTPCKAGMISCWTMPVLFLLGLYNPLCGFVRIVGFCPWCVCVCAAEVKYGHRFAMIQVQIWRVEFIVQSEKFYSHVFSQSDVFCRDGNCSTSTLDAKTLLNLCSLGLGPCLW